MKIGIIGKGFVGSAVAASFNDVKFYDPFVLGSVYSIADLMDCHAIFVCVPTPQNPDGSCDTSLVRSSLQSLVDEQYCGLVIAKSTAPFEIYEEFAEKLELAFVPEFLRANSAVKDYLDSEYMIIGSKNWSVHSSTVEVLYNSDLYKLSNFRRVSIREACLVKYFANSFLATKVSMMNEFHQLCKSVGADWGRTVESLSLDPRIGADHTQVPGPDGKFGWGGACFPKDTASLVSIAEKNGVNLQVLKAAINSNSKVREQNV